MADGASGGDARFWENAAGTGSAAAWKGLAFERVCLIHVGQIKRALGISGIRAHGSPRGRGQTGLDIPGGVRKRNRRGLW